jgi:hypothetical protein
LEKNRKTRKSSRKLVYINFHKSINLHFLPTVWLAQPRPAPPPFLNFLLKKITYKSDIKRVFRYSDSELASRAKADKRKQSSIIPFGG